MKRLINETDNKLKLDREEQLPYNDWVEEVEVKILKKLVDFLYDNNEFYAKKLKSVGFKKGNINNLEDFHLLPFTYKEELVKSQKEYPPLGNYVNYGTQNIIRRIHKTSGTSGNPIYIAMSENDIRETLKAGRRAFICAGVSPGEIVVHCLNYCMWAGGLTDHLSLEAAGAAVIPFGVGNTKSLIKTILDLKPIAISCTPSYLPLLESILDSEFKLKPRQLGLRKGYFGGEGGLQNEKFRKSIEDIWGISAIDANYGMSEALSIFGSECSNKAGLHFHGQGIIYVELIDPVLGTNIPISRGALGELVLTTLTKEVHPLVRYRSRDLIRIIDTDRCECGRYSFRFRIEGRTDRMLVVKGINVFPESVISILANEPEFLSGRFEILIPAQLPIEKLRLIIELKKEISKYDADNLVSKLKKESKDKLGITPEIELAAPGKFSFASNKMFSIRKEDER